MAAKRGEKEVLIFTGVQPAAPGPAQALSTGASVSSIAVDALKQNLDAFVRSLESLLPATKGLGGYRLKGFEVHVGIDAQGRVGFLGIGGEAGAHASLTLQFKTK